MNQAVNRSPAQYHVFLCMCTRDFAVTITASRLMSRVTFATPCRHIVLHCRTNDPVTVALANEVLGVLLAIPFCGWVYAIGAHVEMAHLGLVDDC
ncbi:MULTISPECIES: hypothetical protein [Paraburkholderia]|uniref:hypothetical protein n=1 Tax=Paraburkholderia TaxID=1822464 RepID=UPI0013A68AEE|nr:MULTISPECIES: hypothetical protein [Paraburkholderia]MDH6150503.1 hypothetical protein [Paraburkholderia sp. WSM4179]